MWATVADACFWVGAMVLTSVLGWVSLVAFQKMRPRRLLDSLSKRAVLITGCDSGFGHGLARRLDALGVPVYAGCLFPEGPGARSLAAECSSKLRVLPLDVTSDQQVADAVTAVQEALSGAPGTELWAVVNNAGITDCGYMDITPLEKIQQVLDINMVGAIRVTKMFLPLLKKSKGRIVNVASPLGRLPAPYLGPYCVSKSALIMFSNVLRLEMKKSSVAVCTIEPYLYSTPIADTNILKSKYVYNCKKTLSDVSEDDANKTSQEIERGFRMSHSLAKNDISDMVDEMVTASVGRDLQMRHTPGFKETIFLTTLSSLPTWLWDILIPVFLTAINIIWA